MNETFDRWAQRLTRAAGSLPALAAAGLLIVVWLATGPIFGFSDTWQLVINTTTTVITFLMVFLIQATTNREAKATQLKLDELIRAIEGARNELIAADRVPLPNAERLEREFERIAETGGVGTGGSTARPGKSSRQRSSSAPNGPRGRAAGRG